jgi:acyl-CoA synthetase (NDP forming)
VVDLREPTSTGSLQRLFFPRSVCLVGASSNPAHLAARPLRLLTQHAFGGDVFVVNPRHSEIAGYPCYPSIDHLPVAPDSALIMVPARSVPGVVADCAAKGIPTAVVISSGFEDEANPQPTLALQAALPPTMRLVGPNSEGIWSVPAGLTLTFGSAADRSALLDGGVSLISQSGSLGAACMRSWQDLGVGCRFFVSTGNEIDLQTLDYIDYMVEEGGSSVIAMFVEAIKNGDRLRDIARRAERTGVRLIALRGGRSDGGRRATATHTGRISTADAVYRDLLGDAGILEVQTLRELIDAVAIGERYGARWRLRGHGRSDGIGIVAISGGSRALLADSCSLRNVPLATLTAATTQRLEAILPPFAQSSNPVDVTGEVLNDPDLLAAAVGVVAQDAATDAVVLQYGNGGRSNLASDAGQMAALADAADKPMVLSVLGEATGHRAEDELGLPLATDPDQAIAYVGWLRHFSHHQGADEAPAVPLAAERSRRRPPGLHTWEAQTAFLKSVGIPTPKGVVVPAATDPSTVLGELGFPLVAKALPQDADHKTERGLVILNVERADLDDAAEQLRSRLPDGRSILLQEMWSPACELLLAARHDPDFGPLLVVGAGGTLVEWLSDISYTQLPTTEAAVRATLGRLRINTLLRPFRGRGALDVDAVVEAALRLGAAYLRYDTAHWEIEINPLAVMPAGDGVVALDLLAADSAPGPAETSKDLPI